MGKQKKRDAKIRAKYREILQSNNSQITEVKPQISQDNLQITQDNLQVTPVIPQVTPVNSQISSVSSQITSVISQITSINLPLFGDYDVDREYECIGNVKSNGFTPLMYLIVKKQYDYIRQHIDDLVINSSSENGWTALMLAVTRGNSHIIELLLEYGADVTAESDDGYTALSLAFNGKSDSIIDLLLKWKADINQETSGTNDDTILTSAIINRNDTNMIKLILSKGANVNQENIHGYTPLITAITMPSSIDVIKLLLDSGADVDYETQNGRTALRYSIKSDVPIEIAILLIKRGASINHVNIYGGSVLDLAVENGNNKIIKLLLQENVHFTKDNIIHAISLCNTKAAKLLLKKSTMPNNDYVLIFMRAIKHMNMDIINILVKKDININCEAPDGGTILLSVLEETTSIDLLQIVLDKGADINYETITPNTTPLIHTIGCIRKGDSIERIKFLIDKGAKINYETVKGWTALMKAIQLRNLELIQLLIDKGADVNHCVHKTRTPLTMAINIVDYGISIKIIQLLLKNGADPNRTIYDGYNLLMHYIDKSTCNIEFIKILLPYINNINQRSISGKTVLMMAVMSVPWDNDKLAQIIELLLNAGADPYMKDNDGYDLFDIMKNKHLSLPFLNEWKEKKLIQKITWKNILIEFQFHYTKWMYNDESLRIKLLSYKGKKFNYNDKFINTVFAINNQDQLDVRINELDIINTEKLTLYRQFPKLKKLGLTKEN